jgi:hypothetical protein
MCSTTRASLSNRTSLTPSMTSSPPSQRAHRPAQERGVAADRDPAGCEGQILHVLERAGEDRDEPVHAPDIVERITKPHVRRDQRAQSVQILWRQRCEGVGVAPRERFWVHLSARSTAR